MGETLKPVAQTQGFYILNAAFISLSSVSMQHCYTVCECKPLSTMRPNSWRITAVKGLLKADKSMFCATGLRLLKLNRLIIIANVC